MLRILQNYSSQSFKGLNYSSNVHNDNLKVIKKELPRQDELGKKYDIEVLSRRDLLFKSSYRDSSVADLAKVAINKTENKNVFYLV